MKKEAMLYEKLEDKKVHCYLCAHKCKISSSEYGICGVRQNIDGTLYTLVYGEVIASHVDPIEKKPLYHCLPGSFSYSIATVGCNFTCGFCQNWQISQASKKDPQGVFVDAIKPEHIISQALKQGCKSISYTYTEPTIFFEYAYDTAVLASEAGLYNIFVTNGYMTPDALKQIQPFLKAANVDLKSFRDETYKRDCHARLQPVLDTIKGMKGAGIWVEVTTLIIPGVNDSDEELRDISGFISGIDRNIPWHVSRFHPDYQFTSIYQTPIETLKKAYEIGRDAGLKYIYLGNVAQGMDTFCPKCKKLLTQRTYFQINNGLKNKDECPECKAHIAGIWE